MRECSPGRHLLGHRGVLVGVARDPYARFAKYYDQLYEGGRKVSYDGEVRSLRKAFRRYGVRVESILDLACGTGAHAIRLAPMGYDVVGLDASRAQLAIARRKARERGLRIPFVAGDMRTFSLGRTFDAAICMFGGWGYLVKLRDVRAALRQVYTHLRPGGLFAFEFWGGGGVRSGRKSWTLVDEPVKLIRLSDTVYDPRSRVYSIDMHHVVYRRRRVLEEFTERHNLRIYHITEMKRLLRRAGFRVRATLDADEGWHAFRPAKEGSFRILAIAQRPFRASSRRARSASA